MAQECAPAQNGSKISSGSFEWLQNNLRIVQIADIYGLEPGSSQQGLWSSGYDYGYADLHCRRSRVRIPVGPSCDSSASSLCSLASGASKPWFRSPQTIVNYVILKPPNLQNHGLATFSVPKMQPNRCFSRLSATKPHKLCAFVTSKHLKPTQNTHKTSHRSHVA